MTSTVRPDPRQAYGRRVFDVQAGLYMVDQGVEDAIGRAFDMPYHFNAATRCIRWAARKAALRRTAVAGSS